MNNILYRKDKMEEYGAFDTKIDIYYTSIHLVLCIPKVVIRQDVRKERFYYTIQPIYSLLYKDGKSNRCRQRPKALSYNLSTVNSLGEKQLQVLGKSLTPPP